MHNPGEAKKLGLLAEMPSSTRMQVSSYIVVQHCFDTIV